MPEAFVGPLLAHLVAHEVGHTLGLRHNFKGSSVYSVAQINSDEIKGKKPLAGSVMDYNPVNIKMETGALQGDFAMVGIGPYDHWAIEYGYGGDKDLKSILARVAEPELQYATDEDTYGPDPLARKYDFGSDPLEYSKEQIRLARYHRERLIDKFVKDGESWSKTRKGYEMTLLLQTRSLSTMANWIGGVFVRRDKKGDKDGRPPFEVVPVDKQRAALDFVIENAFRDEAFGLTPELLKRMTQDKWLDEDNYRDAFEDATWPVHDRVMGIQSATLTMLMNPTSLRRVFDNEFRVPAETDMVTLPELLEKLTASIWTELDAQPEKEYKPRAPMISSLRRNLQREQLDRLVDLSMPEAGPGAAYKAIANLALMRLREIKEKTAKILESGGDKLDPYTKAHLTEVNEQIAKALNAQYIYNAKDMGGSGIEFHFHGREQDGQLPKE
jgi:hypothetical protein